ncbi:hypothetical protein BFP72_09995 [Reichenbachiella sp. 5M10]|nr:hypothetical protein BFP72_09995 [Reichenbachiella sp. 5M10]
MILILTCVTAQPSPLQSSDHLPDDSPVAIAQALNLHLDVINLCVRSTYRRQRTYFYYNQRLDEKVASMSEVSKFSSFSAKAVALPTAQYQRAKSTQTDIPQDYRDTFSTLFDSLWELQLGQNKVCITLHDITSSQPSLSDTILRHRVYELLAQLDHMGQEYGRLSTKMEDMAIQIHSQHSPIGESNTAWINSAQGLKSALDTARGYLIQTRAGVYTESHPLDTTQLNHMLRTLAQNRDGNLGNIRDLGPTNGNSAPARYDQVIRQLHRMIDAYHGARRVTAYAPPAYENIVVEFNQAVEHYNQFARLSAQADMTESPSYLLQTTKEQGLYRVSYPESKAPTPPHPTNTLISMEGYAYNHMVLLLDVSGSMNHPTKLPLIKESVQQLSTAMREYDRLSVVVYSDDAHAVLTNVPFTDQDAIATLNSLSSKGKTNAQKGIQLAYQLAHSEYIPQGNNRIILATDGDFDISKETHRLIKSGTKEGIALTVFGFGSRIPNTKDLEHLAKEGKGNYVAVRRNNSLQAMIKELTAVHMHE